MNNGGEIRPVCGHSAVLSWAVLNASSPQRSLNCSVFAGESTYQDDHGPPVPRVSLPLCKSKHSVNSFSETHARTHSYSADTGPCVRPAARLSLLSAPSFFLPTSFFLRLSLVHYVLFNPTPPHCRSILWLFHTFL